MGSEMGMRKRVKSDGNGEGKEGKENARGWKKGIQETCFSDV